MINNETEFTTHSGFVALIGRPNVGKSTLLNRLIGQKISITSSKPQTTRHRILGINTYADTQIIYVDTPGLHWNERRLMNKHMNKAARASLKEVDVVVWLLSALQWLDEDERILELITQVSAPVILAINKVDTIDDKERLLPHLEAVSKKFNFKELVPISAKKGRNVDVLEKVVQQYLPLGPHYYEQETVTDKSLRFQIAEIIREKLTRLFGDELPYAVSVEIESFAENGKVQEIHAVIWVERTGQKGIIIGDKGEALKRVGQHARFDIEILLNQQVHLKLWVKVRENWSDDERSLQSWGYLDLEK